MKMQKKTCSMGQPKLSGGTPDTSWSVLQITISIHSPGTNLYEIATNLKYGAQHFKYLLGILIDNDQHDHRLMISMSKILPSHLLNN